MDTPRLTEDQLAQKLVNSRKIMQKVDTGNYEKGNINEELLKGEPDEKDYHDALTEMKEAAAPSSGKPIVPVNPERIKQSKLPDNIKKAMIEHPIQQITLNDNNIDMGLASKARRLMEQDGIAPKQSSGKQGSSPSPIPNKLTLNSSDLERTLTPIIENIIRKTLDEIVNAKLNQILAAQQTAGLNENLVIKVGDSIFGGKITQVKSAK